MKTYFLISNMFEVSHVKFSNYSIVVWNWNQNGRDGIEASKY